MPIENTRNLRDASLRATIALPAAGASANTPGINLGTASPGRVPAVELAVEVPATPALVDTKKLTLTVQDSADGVTFAAVADLPQIVATGAGGTGAAAIARRFPLPIGLQQYVRLNAAVEASGGNNTAVTATIALCF